MVANDILQVSVSDVGPSPFNPAQMCSQWLMSLGHHGMSLV